MLTLLSLTVYFTSTTYRYSTYYTTDYETITSTYWSTTTDYTTVTQHSKNGVATETEWVTVTQAVKRGGPAVPIATNAAATSTVPPSSEPTMPPRVEMAVIARDVGLRHILEDIGLLEKRDSTAYITVWTTSTVYDYEPGYTSYDYDYITSYKGVLVTRTSVIFDGASTTMTITSTDTVQSQKNDPTPTDPGPQNTTPRETMPNPTPDPTPRTPTEPISVTITLTPTGTSSITGNMVLTTSYSSGAAIIYPVAEPTSTSSSGSSSPTETSHGHGGLSSGAKIGIGVGAALGGVLLLVLVALAVWRMKKSRDARASVSQTPGGWDVVSAATGPPPHPPPTQPVPAVPVMYAAYNEKEPRSPGPSVATTAVASSVPQHPSQAELLGQPQSQSQSHVRSWGSAQELDSYSHSYRTVSPMQELYGSPTSPSELSHDPMPTAHPAQPAQAYYPPVPYRAGAQSPAWN